MRRSSVCGAADGDRHRGVTGSDDMPGIAKRHHDAFANAARRLGIGWRQHHDELFSVVARDQIGLAGVAAKYARGRLQNAISGLVTEAIIDGLEVIQIREGHAQGPFVARRAVEFAPQELIEIGAVVDAGQRVAAGLFLSLRPPPQPALAPPPRHFEIWTRPGAAPPPNLAPPPTTVFPPAPTP